MTPPAEPASGAPARGLACISVDLDSLHHYARIHALPEDALGEEARALVYRLAVPRFLELFSEMGLPATLFVIGEDARRPWGAQALERACAQGLELGNHSATHPYALTRLPADALADEVRGGAEALRAVSGVKPVGFRAPGYTLNGALYAALVEEGYQYDSSVFPAAPYYLAKAGVLAALQLVGRSSRAILDRPGVLLAPRVPYWPDPDQPYRRGRGGVLELPIAVAPWTRVPFIGTVATSFPRSWVRSLYATFRGATFFNFELHGVDLLDSGDGVPAELAARQRDLRVPWRRKRQRLEEIFGWLLRDYELATLSEAANRLRGPQTPREP